MYLRKILLQYRGLARHRILGKEISPKFQEFGEVGKPERTEVPSAIKL